MSSKRRGRAATGMTATPPAAAAPAPSGLVSQETKDAAAAAGRGVLIADGYASFASRQGIGAENLLSTANYIDHWLTRDHLKLTRMYCGSWICGKIIDEPAQDMIRAGITVKSTDKPEVIDELIAFLESSGCFAKSIEGLQWGALYGGAVVFIDVEGQDPSTPLDIETVGLGQFKGLKVFDRWQLVPNVHSLVQGGPNDGLPETYRLIGDFTTTMPTGVDIHHTRIGRCVPIKPPRERAIMEQFWGVSILERLVDRLVAFDQTTFGTANLVNKAYLRVLKLQGLKKVLAAGGLAEENVTKGMRYTAMMEAATGLTAIDADDDLTGEHYTFAGLDDVLIGQGMQLSGGSGIPLVKFFGQPPKGFDATGEIDLKMYEEMIHRRQQFEVRPWFNTIVQVAYRSLFGRAPGKDFRWQWAPQRQMTETEKAEYLTSVTSAITTAFSGGVIRRRTALLELRQQSEVTGVFTNITEEDIAEADLEDPPGMEEDEEDDAPTTDSRDAMDIVRGFVAKLAA